MVILSVYGSAKYILLSGPRVTASARLDWLRVSTGYRANRATSNPFGVTATEISRSFIMSLSHLFDHFTGSSASGTADSGSPQIRRNTFQVVRILMIVIPLMSTGLAMCTKRENSSGVGASSSTSYCVPFRSVMEDKTCLQLSTPHKRAHHGTLLRAISMFPSETPYLGMEDGSVCDVNKPPCDGRNHTVVAVAERIDVTPKIIYGRLHFHFEDGRAAARIALGRGGCSVLDSFHLSNTTMSNLESEYRYVPNMAVN